MSAHYSREWGVKGMKQHAAGIHRAVQTPGPHS